MGSSGCTPPGHVGTCIRAASSRAAGAERRGRHEPIGQDPTAPKAARAGRPYPRLAGSPSSIRISPIGCTWDWARNVMNEFLKFDPVSIGLLVDEKQFYNNYRAELQMPSHSPPSWGAVPAVPFCSEIVRNQGARARARSQGGYEA